MKNKTLTRKQRNAYTTLLSMYIIRFTSSQFKEADNCLYMYDVNNNVVMCEFPVLINSTISSQGVSHIHSQDVVDEFNSIIIPRVITNYNGKPNESYTIVDDGNGSVYLRCRRSKKIERTRKLQEIFENQL